jgi:FlaG/FlaF family flagellin (archaellin)
MHRRSSGAVAPVVGTVLVVAVTVVLAAVLFVIVSSMLTPPPPPPLAISFRTMGWSNGTNTAEISAVTGAGAISVADLEYIIRDSQAEVIYTGKAGNPVTSSSVTVDVLYEDLDVGDRITAGDKIRIIVTPSSGSAIVDGGIFEMYSGGRQIASHAIS